WHQLAHRPLARFGSSGCCPSVRLRRHDCAHRQLNLEGLSPKWLSLELFDQHVTILPMNNGYGGTCIFCDFRQRCERAMRYSLHSRAERAPLNVDELRRMIFDALGAHERVMLEIFANQNRHEASIVADQLPKLRHLMLPVVPKKLAIARPAIP